VAQQYFVYKGTYATFQQMSDIVKDRTDVQRALEEHLRPNRPNLVCPEDLDTTNARKAKKRTKNDSE